MITTAPRPTDWHDWHDWTNGSVTTTSWFVSVAPDNVGDINPSSSRTSIIIKLYSRVLSHLSVHSNTLHPLHLYTYHRLANANTAVDAMTTKQKVTTTTNDTWYKESKVEAPNYKTPVITSMTMETEYKGAFDGVSVGHYAM